MYETEIIPIIPLDTYWTKHIINYQETQFPPRSWEWASASLLTLKRGIKYNEHIEFLRTHKRDYLRFLYKHKLKMTRYEKHFGFNFIYIGLDEDEKKEMKEMELFFNIKNERHSW